MRLLIDIICIFLILLGIILGIPAFLIALTWTIVSILLGIIILVLIAPFLLAIIIGVR